MTRMLPAMTAAALFVAAPLFAAGEPGAQDITASMRQSAICSPVGTAPVSISPRVAGFGRVARTLFNNGDQVAIATPGDGVEVGQRYLVRRPMKFKGAPRAEHTIGALTITEASEARVLARIDMTCDAIALGDYLEPFEPLALPDGSGRSDASGQLEPDGWMPVSYGLDKHEMAGGRDFVLAGRGAEEGVEVGTRYAVFHTKKTLGDSDRPFAEAIVVSVFPDSSLLRITEARDAVMTGDRMVRRAAPLPSLVAKDVSETAVAVAAVSEPTPELSSARDASSHDDETFAFDDLYFDFNRDTLKPEAIVILERAIEVFKSNPALRVSVDGYTCNVGSAEFNLALGERRANTVRKYLESHGVDAGRLSVVSYGEEQPKYDNAKEDTRKFNRRAALTVTVHKAN